MKRVVKRRGGYSGINEHYTYIGIRKDDNNPCILTALGFCCTYRFFDMNDGFTYGNGYGRDDGYGSITEAIDSLYKSHRIYQFPTFRAAMQYYIEQTKEVEGE
jgi:hypothetical protein